MTDDPTKRRQQRVEVSLKVQLQYPDRDAFVERFAANVSKTGLFIRARDPAPVGSRVRFEYRLSDNSRVLRGLGIVRWVRSVEQASEPNDPPGMGIEFVDLDAQSEDLVTHIVGTKGEGARAPRRGKPTPTPAPLAATAPVASAPPTQPPTPAPSAAPTSAATADLLRKLQTKAPAATATAAPVADALDNLSVSARPALVVDLCGTDVLGTLVVQIGSRADRFEEHRVRLAFDAATGGLSDAGVWLPSLFTWAQDSWPAPRAVSIGRRLGVEVIPTAGGHAAVRLGPRTLACSELLAAGIGAIAEAYAEAARDAATIFVVVPAAAPKETLGLIDKLLARTPLASATRLTDALAVQRSVGVTLGPGQFALSVQVTYLDTRVALVDSDGNVRASRSLPEAGLWDADRALAQQASVALLRDHGVDVDSDPSLRLALLDQVRALRQNHVGATPWTLTIAGAMVSHPIAQVQEWTAQVSERVAIASHDLLLEHELSTADVEACVLVTDELPWPGLVEAFEATTGLSSILPDAGPWIRIDGATSTAG